MTEDKKRNILMSIRKIKITPFLIFAIIALIYAIRYNLFNFWTLKGGASLIGIYAIAALGISIVLIILDRQFLKKMVVEKNGIYLIRDKDNFKNSNRINRQELKSRSSKIYNVNLSEKFYRAELITINNASVDFDSLEIKIKNLLIRE